MMRFASGARAAGLLAMAACSGLVSVDAPDVVKAEDYETAAGVSALVAGAITGFNRTYAGASTVGAASFVGSTGLMADELFATSSTSEVAAVPDQRDASDPRRIRDTYSGLHDARLRLLSTVRSQRKITPDSTARIGQMYALLGYTSVFLAEYSCNGIPLGNRDAELEPIYGQPLTTLQILDSAIAMFDSAATFGADSSRILNLARVGKGRALLNQGKFADAAAAVTAVPTNYVYSATFVTGVVQNGLFSATNTSTAVYRSITVPEREGTNGMNWRTAAGAGPDPRAALVNKSPAVIGDDNTTQVWQFAQYQASNAPVKVATGIEARLIEAEASLQAGNNGAWLSALNALRALGAANGGVNGLAPLTDPGTPSGRVDLHFRERALWLFLTGHRLGDLRRLVRQYARSSESVFPTGTWRDGLTYGNATNAAPPAEQLSNPNFKGCADRNP